MLKEIELNKEEKEKLDKLTDIISNYKSALVAYSGGVDSGLLAYLSSQILPSKALAVTVKSEFITEHELSEAQNLAKELGFNHKVIKMSVLDKSDVTRNDPERCGYCKRLVFNELIKLARDNGYENVFDGSNLDDLGDYRPGLRVIKELGIKSPFLEAGITKNNIRNIAKALSISNWNKPALACLASRIPYGSEITQEKLDMVEKAEEYLRNLDYTGFRVRHHDNIARIELKTQDIEKFVSRDRESVNSKFQELGYNYVCLDLKGYRTGSLNEVVK